MVTPLCDYVIEPVHGIALCRKDSETLDYVSSGTLL